VDHPYGFLDRLIDSLDVQIEDVQVTLRDSLFMVMPAAALSQLPSALLLHASYCVVSESSYNRRKHWGKQVTVRFVLSRIDCWPLDCRATDTPPHATVARSMPSAFLFFFRCS
jgi:hypothetical protein